MANSRNGSSALLRFGPDGIADVAFSRRKWTDAEFTPELHRNETLGASYLGGSGVLVAHKRPSLPAAQPFRHIAYPRSQTDFYPPTQPQHYLFCSAQARIPKLQTSANSTTWLLPSRVTWLVPNFVAQIDPPSPSARASWTVGLRELGWS